MSKKTDKLAYSDEPVVFGKVVKDRIPKGQEIKKAKVRVFKEDGSVFESVFDQIRVDFPGSKKAVTVRYDQDVIDYFKSFGPGYQSKMNAVLKAFVEHEKHKTPR
ncbi:MAG: BrnA antitoxin family protein [bacterium]|nr:BrnA antitoxin family protein [bacterium]